MSGLRYDRLMNWRCARRYRLGCSDRPSRPARRPTRPRCRAARGRRMPRRGAARAADRIGRRRRRPKRLGTQTEAATGAGKQPLAAAAATPDTVAPRRRRAQHETATIDARRGDAAVPDPLASLDPADRADRREDARPARRQGRHDLRQQEGARGGRGVLSEAQFRAALVRQGASRTRAPRRSIARIKAVDADGLDPDDYKIPNLAGDVGADAQAEAD